MTSSTTYSFGDVIAIRFKVREDDARPKPRPAIVISVSEYQDSRSDLVMVAVSRRIDRNYFGDCRIEDWQQAGLKSNSKAKGVFRTVRQREVRDRIGELSDNDKARLRESLNQIFGLSDA